MVQWTQKSRAKIEPGDWTGSAAGVETTLHQLSPYIGKIKSTMAASLISRFTKKGDFVCDPFSGSGTIALEAWLAGRRVTANDSSPYAHLLTRAKLFPYGSIKHAFADIEDVAKLADKTADNFDLRRVPLWVRQFFHPETLREILTWNSILSSRDLYFLRSCLMGILHHQRPGFLSFPSSHTVPYLRKKKFPRSRFPKLYEYRSLRDRLERKVTRAFRRIPDFDTNLDRACFREDAARFVPSGQIDAVITSPPYMRQLNYGRDNRLRLWLLGVPDWKRLDEQISPSEKNFLNLIRSCLDRWRLTLLPSGRCVLILGDTWSRLYDLPLPDVVEKIAVEEVGGYAVECRYCEEIPVLRRVRRGYCGSQSETILVLAVK